MKTIKEVNAEIADIERFISDSRKERDKKKQLSSAKIKKELKRVEFLRFCIRYLDSNPNESFIASEVERLEKFIKSKYSQFGYWRNNVAPVGLNDKKAKELYDREMDMKLYKKQLSVCRFFQPEIKKTA